MAGNPENASLWADADVYVSQTPFTATIDQDLPIAGLVGLLSGDAGFGNTREMESNDFYAWGGILVRTSNRNIKVMKSFTLLEDNANTRAIVWPGSTATKLVVPRPSRMYLGFELREGDRTRRLITVRPAQVMVDGDFSESEGDLTQYPISATIYPNGAGELFDVQDTLDEV